MLQFLNFNLTRNLKCTEVWTIFNSAFSLERKCNTSSDLESKSLDFMRNVHEEYTLEVLEEYDFEWIGGELNRKKKSGKS